MIPFREQFLKIYSSGRKGKTQTESTYPMLYSQNPCSEWQMDSVKPGASDSVKVSHVDVKLYLLVGSPVASHSLNWQKN